VGAWLRGAWAGGAVQPGLCIDWKRGEKSLLDSKADAILKKE